MFDYILYRIGQLIALSLPLKSAYKIAVFVSDIHYIFADKDRQIVRDNLKAIFPDKSDKEIKRIRLKVFRNFAKYLVDFFRFERLNSEYVKNYIVLKNMKYFDEELKKGKGAVILTAHIGNWELGGVVIALLGYPFWAVALPHKDKRVNKFFNSQRQSKGLQVIPLGKAVRQCLNLLRENKLVGLVGDRDFTEKGRVMDFFGKPTFFPEGPAAFSLKTGSAIIPGFMVRNPDDTFTLTVEKPIEFTPSGNKEQDISELMRKYKLVIEAWIRQHPDQWYMFRKFWIDDKNESLRNHANL